MASLNEVLGTTDDRRYNLVDDANFPPPVASSIAEVINLALQQRPDLQAVKLSHEADVKFTRAELDQFFPTVSGLGVVGITPVGSSTYFAQR